jgi:hypothetical protein
MSSLAVREEVRAAWLTLMPDVRYIDTINRSLPYNPPLPLPAVWGTLQFEVTTRRQLTMGTNPWVEEIGVVNIIILAKSGHGDASAVEEATNAMRIWDGWYASGGDIYFQNVHAPRQLLEESQGDWVLFVVPCDYKAQERVALP